MCTRISNKMSLKFASQALDCQLLSQSLECQVRGIGLGRDRHELSRRNLATSQQYAEILQRWPP